MAFRPIEESEGFKPLDEVAASRVKPALTLDQMLAEKNAGEFPVQSQPLAAFSRGALNSILAGTPEAGAKLAGFNPQNDPNSPEFTDPNAFATGETIGSALPLGRIASVGKGLWAATKEGMRLGGVYGTGQGVSKEAKEETPEIKDALTSGASEGGKGVVLGGAIPVVAGGLTRLIPTKQNILDDLLKLNPSEKGKMQRSASGGYVQAAETVSPFLKKGDGVPEFIEASSKALDKAADTFKPIIEKSDPAYVHPDTLFSKIDDALKDKIPNPETRQQILMSSDLLSDLTHITPQNFLKYASKINKEISQIYKNPSAPIKAEDLLAKEAIRDVYGETIRKILEDAGQDPSVYSGYGAIKEMSSQIGNNFLTESYKLSATSGRSPLNNVMSGLESGPGGFNLSKAIQQPIAAITGGEKARMNSQTNKLIENFIGYGRESTNEAKANKLDTALKFLNTLNKNNSDPVMTIEEGLKKASGK